jgi:predicted HTH transcriptional regulator
LNIEPLIQGGESETVEFKERVTSPEMLARIISAFSNTNGGTILIGIREPNIVAGINPEQFERVYQRAIQRITGTAKTASQIVNLQEKSVGVITVEKSSAPVGSSEGYFTRIGSSDRALGPDSLSALFSKEVNPNTAIESLSQTVSKQTEEIGKLRESFEKANSWKRKFFYAFLGALATGFAKLILAAFGIVIG